MRPLLILFLAAAFSLCTANAYPPYLPAPDPEPATYAEWLAILDKLLQLPREIDESPQSNYITIDIALAHAYRLGGEKTFPELLARFEKADAHTFATRCNMFHMLAAIFFKQELERLRAEQRPPLVFAKAEALPDNKLSPELAEAWSAYRAATAPFKQKFGPLMQKKELGMEANEKAFFRLLGDVLAGRGENLAERLAVYYNDSYIHPSPMDRAQKQAIWLALLRERRLSEAVGVALPYPHAKYGYSYPFYNFNDAQIKVDFFQTCGLDWEKLSLGVLAERECAPDKKLDHATQLYMLLLRDSGYVEPLRDSGKYVASLLELSRKTDARNLREYVSVLSRYVKPRHPPVVFYNPHIDPTSEPLQRAILARLCEVVADPGLPRNDDYCAWGQAVSVLLNLRRSETKETLQRLSTDAKFGQEVIKVLQEMREKIVLPPE